MLPLRLVDADLDLRTGEVRRDDSRIALTPTELRLVRYLHERVGEVVTREALLTDVLGYAPNSQSQALHVAIRRLRGKIETRPETPVHLRTVRGVGWIFEPLPDAAPHQTGAGFFGRDDQVQWLLDTCEADGGFVTVLGGGGVGKTRLAWVAVGRMARRGLFCDLAAAREERDITAVVAATLGCDGPGVGPDHVGRALARAERPIAILDNVEQVADAIVRLVARWRDQAPTVTWVATSQRPLGIYGERILDLPPLDIAPAVELFAERVAMAGGQTRDADRPHIEALVAELDGLPLAIELCAPHAVTREPSAILDELVGRFGLLRHPGATGPPRQRALLNTLQWSWDLLDAEDRAAVLHCCAFRGGFTLRAAEDVLQSDLVIDAVQRLLDRSFLFRSGRAHDTRFDLFSSVRAFATRLDPEVIEAARARHAAHFAAYGEWESWFSPDDAISNDRRRLLVYERSNLVSAMEWATNSGRAELTRDLGYALADVAVRVNVEEAPVLLRGALDSATTALDRGRLGYHLGHVLDYRDLAHEANTAYQLAYSAAKSAGDDVVMGFCKQAIGNLLTQTDQLEEAEPVLLEARAHFERTGSRRFAASAMNVLGILYARTDRVSEAIALLRAAESDLESMGDHYNAGIAVGNLARALNLAGDHAGAIDACEKAWRVCREAGDEITAAHFLKSQVLVHLESGDLSGARSAAERALAAFVDLGMPVRQAWLHVHLATIEERAGDLDAAATELAVAAQLAAGRNPRLEGLVSERREQLRVGREAASEADLEP